MRGVVEKDGFENLVTGNWQKLQPVSLLEEIVLMIAIFP